MREKTASSPGFWMDLTRITRFRCRMQVSPKRAILETYTKQHSAEYQAQAFIDLAISMGKEVHDWDKKSRKSSSAPAITRIM